MHLVEKLTGGKGKGMILNFDRKGTDRFIFWQKRKRYTFGRNG